MITAENAVEVVATLKGNPWQFLCSLSFNDPARGLVPFQPWPHLRELIQAAETYRLLLVLKSRKIGITTAFEGYSLHGGLFQPGSQTHLFSQGEDEAKALITAIRYMWEHLEPSLQFPLGEDSTQALSFPLIGSAIHAWPSTKHAGRSLVGNRVIMDEADYHPYAEDSYAALKPMIDDGRGQLILVSTANRENTDSLFKRLWRGAPGNGFHKLFFGWDRRPGRDEAWFQRMCQEYEPEQREKEFPATEAEALSPSQAGCYFHVLTLLRLSRGQRQGEVFKGYVVGRRYTAGVDPAGQGKDRHSLSILDCQTGEFVADYTSTEPVEEHALKAVDLLNKYRQPFVSGEATGVGLAYLENLRHLGYPVGKLYQRSSKEVGFQEKLLWATPGASLRDRILIDLAEGIRQGAIIIYSGAAIDECLSFLKREKGHPEAAEGAWDDRVFSMAWAVFGSKQLPPIEVGSGQVVTNYAANPKRPELRMW